VGGIPCTLQWAVPSPLKITPFSWGGSGPHLTKNMEPTIWLVACHSGRVSLLAPAHPGGPGKKGRKMVVVVVVKALYKCPGLLYLLYYTAVWHASHCQCGLSAADAKSYRLITFCVSRRRRKMYCGHVRVCVCLCVCLSTAVRPHYCTDLDVTWGHSRGCPLVVHYWADLQSGHGLRCNGNITRTLVTSLRPSLNMTT